MGGKTWGREVRGVQPRGAPTVALTQQTRDTGAPGMLNPQGHGLARQGRVDREYQWTLEAERQGAGARSRLGGGNL